MRLASKRTCKKELSKKDAPIGIRTRVAGVRVLHDWPCYTIGAHFVLGRFDLTAPLKVV